MKNKEKYEKHTILITPLEEEDIITCSGGGTNIFNDNGSIKDIWHF